MTVTMSHSTKAQLAAEQRLEYLWSLPDESTAEEPYVPEDFGFCGCTTCIVREVLESATPDLYRAIVEMLRTHNVEIPVALETLLDD